MSSRLRSLASVVTALAREPRLWFAALVQWRRCTPQQWWRRRPFLPLPSGDYLRFRVLTQYGEPQHRIVPADVVSYIKWCRRQTAGR